MLVEDRPALNGTQELSSASHELFSGNLGECWPSVSLRHWLLKHTVLYTSWLALYHDDVRAKGMVCSACSPFDQYV
jgi:hypothetical protein